MAFEVVMPRLGWNMEEGALAGWRKRDGDTVATGEILFEVESDKAIQEVEALEAGILRIPPDSPPQGKVVPVGTLLAYLLKPGEAMPASARESSQATAQELLLPRSPALDVATAAAVPSPLTSAPPPTASAPPAAFPRLPRRHPAISPRAKRVAEQLGVEWARLRGSGRAGRIVERDVREAVSSARLGSAAPGTAVTLTTEADATELVQLRSMFKKEGIPVMPSYNDMLILVAASALREHPECNVSLLGDSTVSPHTVNIGFAVDTERGLLVPVIRDAQKMSLRGIAETTARLIEQARTGKINPDELRGSTFMVTNLGKYEIDAFTPIIKPPESAILGAGRIVAKQVVTDRKEGKVAIRDMVFLSLTFNYRIIDVVPAARFLQKVKLYIEKPYIWLAGT
jgi:pyruvate dehydrogenase E2 component (dihydrolipoamide acetyltransferase)